MAFDGLYEDTYSVGFADQSAYDEEAAVSGNWMTCQFPQITVEREIFSERRASGQPMASSKRGIGARRGTMTIRQLLRSQSIGFDASAGNPATTAPELDLLQEVMGASHVGAYAGSGAVVTDANKLNFGAALKLGCAYAFGDAAAIRGIGWVKELDATTVYSLFQDTRAVVDEDDKLFPLVTMVPSLTTAPTPKTFRLVGFNTGQDIRIIGCMPTEVVLELDPAGQVYIAFTYDFTDINEEGASGGLQSATAYQPIPPLLGVHNARVVLGGNLGVAPFDDYDDGTADPDGTCDVGSLRMAIRCEYAPIKCHGGRQGRSNMKLRNKVCELTFSVPKVSELAVGTKPVFTMALEEQSPVSFSLEVGTKSGALFAVLVPAPVPSAEPGRGVIDGKYSYTVTMESGEYSGDGAATDAGQSTARIAVG